MSPTQSDLLEEKQVNLLLPPKQAVQFLMRTILVSSSCSKGNRRSVQSTFYAFSPFLMLPLQGRLSL